MRFGSRTLCFIRVRIFLSRSAPVLFFRNVNRIVALTSLKFIHSPPICCYFQLSMAIETSKHPARPPIQVMWMAALSMLFVMCFDLSTFGQTAPSKATDKPRSSSPVFSIVVDPPPAPIHMGAPVKVKITVTNVSGHAISWESARGPDSEYRAFTFLLTKDGQEAETTYLHRKISGRPRPEDPIQWDPTSLFPGSDPPGNVSVMTIDLKRLYDIKQPGTYRLSVSRFDDYSNTVVRATPVTLSIVP